MLAAGLLQTPAEKLEFMDGRVRVVGDPAPGVGLADVAGVAHGRADLLPPGMEMGLEATVEGMTQGGVAQGAAMVTPSPVAPLGVLAREVPASPNRLWQLLSDRDARPASRP